MLFQSQNLRIFTAALQLFFIGLSASAQDAVQKAKADQLIAGGMKHLTRPDSLIKYADEAYKVSKDANYTFGIAQSLKLTGIYNHRKSNFDEAIKNYTAARELYVELNNDLETAKINLNLATTYNSRSDYVNSIQYAIKALRTFDRLNEPNGQGRVLNLLGITASGQKDYKNALIYFKRYNALAKKAKDSTEIGTSFNNIGSTFHSLGKPDSAIYYFKQSAEIHRLRNNLQGAGTVLQNIGGMYNDKGDFRNAIIYHTRALANYQKLGNKEYQSHEFYNIGLAYKGLKDTVSARKWFEKALDLSMETGVKQIIQHATKSIAELNASSGAYKEAYEQMKVSLAQKDSMFNDTRIRSIEDLKVQYETEKKESLIKQLHQQQTIDQLKVRQRNIQLGVAIVALILIAVIAFLIVNRQKLRQRAKMQAEIARQQELAAMAVLGAEENERRRIATELHDGVGQLISISLMNMNQLFSELNFRNESEQEKARNVVSLIGESYDEMRSISHQMMPNSLIKAGLTAAVRDFLNKIDKDKIKITLQTTGLQERLDDQTESVIYRVIQEACNNVIKHARATKLDININKDEEGIDLSIEDNGVGFDKSKLSSADGIGMKNILSRITFLRGTVDVDTAPGKGTLVMVHIPV